MDNELPLFLGYLLPLMSYGSVFYFSIYKGLALPSCPLFLSSSSHTDTRTQFPWLRFLPPLLSVILSSGPRDRREHRGKRGRRLFSFYISAG